MQTTNKPINILFRFLIMGVFFSFLGLILFYPNHPNTIIGAVVWFFSIPIIWVLLEWIGTVIFSRKIEKQLHKDNSKVSFKRIGYGVISIGFGLLIFTLIDHLQPESLQLFLEKNISNSWK